MPGLTWEDGLGISFSKPVKIHGVRLLGNEGEEYDVKLEVWSQITEKKFHSKQDDRMSYGFDVMLPVPIRVQADFIVYLKVTMTGCRIDRFGSEVKTTIETNGTTINFFDIPPPSTDDFVIMVDSQIDEIIYSEVGYME